MPLTPVTRLAVFTLLAAVVTALSTPVAANAADLTLTKARLRFNNTSQ